MKYLPNDIIEVLHCKYTSLKEVEEAGGNCSFWLSNGMVPPLAGQRFRVMKQVGTENVAVYAGGKDRTGFPHTHLLPLTSVMLYHRPVVNTLKAAFK